MSSPARIVIVGAGGFVFPLRVLVDLLSYEHLQDSVFVLHDIAPERLERTRRRLDHIVGTHALPARVEAATDRRRALDGADYVIVTFEVGGLDAYALDLEIPRRYGVDQTVGDTLGPGGVFRGLRTVAVLRAMARELRELAPRALVLQYANPMAINCWALREEGIDVVGLCHSVQHTSTKLIEGAGLRVDDVEFRAAGINHLAWFTEFTRDGVDVYPAIREAILARYPAPHVVDGRGRRFERPYTDWRPTDGDVYQDDVVRAEMLRWFGFFHTESGHHNSEYVPWFRKDAPVTDAYIPRRWDYLELCRRHESPEQQREQASLGVATLDRSEEFCAPIVAALRGGPPATIYGNVGNRVADGLLAIANLPADATVEVACSVDASGVRPVPFGELPSQCAAIDLLNINVQRLAVEAALTGDCDAAFRAVALDPYTGARLTLPEIRHMVDAMLAEEARWLPQFAR